jgi:hypothetical protein
VFKRQEEPIENLTDLRKRVKKREETDEMEEEWKR